MSYRNDFFVLGCGGYLEGIFCFLVRDNSSSWKFIYFTANYEQDARHLVISGESIEVFI